MAFSLCFLPLLLMPILGLFLPPPKERIAGFLFWSMTAFTALLLLYLAVAGVIVTVQGELWGLALALTPLGMLAAHLANAFWVIGQQRRLPADMEEEARREARLRLHRRLWMPFCAGFILLLAALVLTYGLSRAAPAPPPAAPAPASAP